MQRFVLAKWILVSAFAAGLLPGCADVIAEQGGGSADPRGASSPVGVDTRADRRAYYAYARSVWAEIQGDLDGAVTWGREALRFDPASRRLRTHLATVLLKKGDFRFCTMDYIEDFSEFAARAAEKIAAVRQHPTLKDGPGQDDLLFMTAIPWVSFTSFLHPVRLHPVDSVPRFAWGKFLKESRRLKMPLGAQAHHALMDGYHIGRFYEAVQDYLDHPDLYLAEE